MEGGKLKTLADLMKGQRLRYGGAIAALAASTLLMYLVPLVVRNAIDCILRKKTEAASLDWIGGALQRIGGVTSAGRALIIAALLVVAVTLLSGIFTYLRGRWSALASENIARSLRNRLYDHLQHLPMAYHDKVQTGDVVQRCTSDVDTVRMFYSSQVVEIARAALLIATVLPILILLDWRMTLTSVAVLPVIVGFAVLFFSRVQKSFKRMDEAEGAMTTALQENLTGIRVVRAFARQDFERRRFGEKNCSHRQMNWRLYKIMAYYWSSSDMLCFTQSALVLFVGAWRVSQGRMSVGTMVAFLSYAQMFIWPVRQMGRTLTELGKAMVSVGRIQEILQAKREADPSPLAAENAEGPHPDLLPEYPEKGKGRGTGQIELRNVHFAHGEKSVLTDVTLSIPAGSTLALLGPSGSGKTTLVAVLLRLYDYDSGSITLDGVELKDMPRKHVRSQFGVVLQEPFLYSRTLRQNIKLGRQAATDEEMAEAATMAAIHESIDAFDQKYDTIVGERGVTLSGGQRQRVAIARAILRDAPVVILDDALSAVDMHTETTILDELKRRRGRHTTLLIAHRLSTLMHADQIAVLERGRIVQLGTHDELVRQDGLYRRLWQIQGALEEDLREEMAQANGTPTASVAAGAIAIPE